LGEHRRLVSRDGLDRRERAATLDRDRHGGLVDRDELDSRERTALLGRSGLGDWEYRELFRGDGLGEGGDPFGWNELGGLPWRYRGRRYSPTQRDGLGRERALLGDQESGESIGWGARGRP
jgi:hypothetical protein